MTHQPQLQRKAVPDRPYIVSGPEEVDEYFNRPVEVTCSFCGVKGLGTPKELEDSFWRLSKNVTCPDVRCLIAKADGILARIATNGVPF